MEEGPKETSPETKISKSLPQLLSEVAEGQYADFQKWLTQNNVTSLNLAGQLSEEQIEPQFMSRLAQALHGTQVTRVNLSRNRMGEGYDDKENENAQELEKEATQRKEAAIETFVKDLAGTQVKELDLSENYMGFNQTLKCIEALSQTQITSLLLNGTKAFLGHNVDLSKFTQAIKKSSLQSLDLSFNTFGSQALQQLAEGLKGAHKLTTLKLANTGITAENGVNIVAALKDSAITTLDLGWNNLGPGVVGIMKELKNCSITTLFLYNVGITPDIAEHLVEELKNCSLTEIDLSMNPITDKGMEHIAKGLEGSQIIAINLSNCRVANKETIAQLLAHCIPNSCLLKMKLGFENNAISQAIKLNELRFLLGPYSIVRNAQSALPGLPLEIQEHILNFLPAMSIQKIRNYQKIAEKAEQKAQSNEKPPPPEKQKPKKNG